MKFRSPAPAATWKSSSMAFHLSQDAYDQPRGANQDRNPSAEACVARVVEIQSSGNSEPLLDLCKELHAQHSEKELEQEKEESRRRNAGH